MTSCILNDRLYVFRLQAFCVIGRAMVASRRLTFCTPFRFFVETFSFWTIIAGSIVSDSLDIKAFLLYTCLFINSGNMLRWTLQALPIFCNVCSTFALGLNTTQFVFMRNGIVGASFTFGQMVDMISLIGAIHIFALKGLCRVLNHLLRTMFAF